MKKTNNKNLIQQNQIPSQNLPYEKNKKPNATSNAEKKDYQ